MIASVLHKLVFLHVPKNAGSAVRAAIKSAIAEDESLVEGWGFEDGLDLAHLLPPELKRRFPAVHELLGCEDIRSVAIVRDPLARSMAAFRQHRTAYGNHPAACGTFAAYLDRIEEGAYRHGENAYLFIHGAPQHEFLWCEDRLVVRSLLRLDDPLFYHKLCLSLGVALPVLERSNVSRTGETYIRAADAARILDLYAKDYELIDSIAL
jgi:hypothetical protein